MQAGPEEKKAEVAEKQPSLDPLQEVTDLLKRTQANFENYRKQVEKRMPEMKQTASKDVILQILPIMDNLELALNNSDIKHHDEFVTGVKLILHQINILLENNNVKIIETKDKPYDPYCHEALLKVESPVSANIIMEEFQKGFTFHGQVLRPAKVKISAGQTQHNNNTIKQQKQEEINSKS